MEENIDNTSKKPGMETCRRLADIKKSLGITWDAFGREIGAPGSTLRQVSGNRLAVSKKLALKVCQRYPQFDGQWLLYGVGDMYAKNNPDGPAPAISQSVQVMDSRQIVSLAEHNKEIQYLNNMIDLLRNENDNLNKIIESLNKRIEWMETQINTYNADLILQKNVSKILESASPSALIEQ